MHGVLDPLYRKEKKEIRDEILMAIWKIKREMFVHEKMDIECIKTIKNGDVPYIAPSYSRRHPNVRWYDTPSLR